MRIWRIRPVVLFEHEDGGKYILWSGRRIVHWEATNNRIVFKQYQKYFRDAVAFQSFLGYLQYLEATGEQMARWNPKPTICFERKDHGTILIIGKKIIQFDTNWKKLREEDMPTFYHASQRAWLMIGADGDD